MRPKQGRGLRVLGDRRAHTVYTGGEDVALWYLLKKRDRCLCGEHGRVLLSSRVLGGRHRNLDHWTRLLLHCCQRIWWQLWGSQQGHRVTGNSRMAHMRRVLCSQGNGWDSTNGAGAHHLDELGSKTGRPEK